MKVAARLSGRVVKLVLLEPIPFQLLAQAGRKDAFAEAMNFVQHCQEIWSRRRMGDGRGEIRRLLGRRGNVA
jgi:hypothetical protein